MCSISMAGQTGELSTQPGFDYMASAYGGITSAIGEGDRGPVQVPIAMGDSATGVSAAMAVGFALLHRERNGEGQHIDCSLLDTYVQMHEELIPRVSIRGKEAIPPRSGSQHFNGGPTGVFDTVGGKARRREGGLRNDERRNDNEEIHITASAPAARFLLRGLGYLLCLLPLAT